MNIIITSLGTEFFSRCSFECRRRRRQRRRQQRRQQRRWLINRFTFFGAKNELFRFSDDLTEIVKNDSKGSFEKKVDFEQQNKLMLLYFL